MTSSSGPKLRSQVSFVKGAWVVTIFNGDHTENRSFRNEVDARDYAEARVVQLR
jgi:hypothetical protein